MAPFPLPTRSDVWPLESFGTLPIPATFASVPPSPVQSDG